MKATFFKTALAAVMLATASMGSMTVLAANTAESAETTIPKVEIEADKQQISVETTTITSNDGLPPDYFGDPYYDTDGNATLIKSEQIIYNTEEMQFIAVTTKDGHVFYVLINYTAADGRDNVYFLNKVDDYDLYALLYAGTENDENKETITPEQAAQAAEEANGRVKPKSDSVSDTSESAEKSEENAGNTEETTPAKPMNMNSIYLVFGAVALIGIGAAAFMLTKKKAKGKSAVADNYEDEPDYVEDEKLVNEDDEEINFYDDNQDE